MRGENRRDLNLAKAASASSAEIPAASSAAGFREMSREAEAVRDRVARRGDGVCGDWSPPDWSARNMWRMLLLPGRRGTGPSRKLSPAPSQRVRSGRLILRNCDDAFAVVDQQAGEVLRRSRTVPVRPARPELAQDRAQRANIAAQGISLAGSLRGRGEFREARLLVVRFPEWLGFVRPSQGMKDRINDASRRGTKEAAELAEIRSSRERRRTK